MVSVNLVKFFIILEFFLVEISDARIPSNIPSTQKQPQAADTLVYTTKGDLSGIGTPEFNGRNKQLFSKAIGFLPPRTPSCTCGERAKSKIIGGSEATLGEFPWRCLMDVRNAKTISTCTCVIISKNWVLAAGHCTRSVLPESKITIQVGDLNRPNGSEWNNLLISVDRVEVHPSYVPLPPAGAALKNDIALIHLQTPITFNKIIQPICLPFKMRGKNYVGSTATISGWGIDESGQLSAVLKKASTEVVNKSLCDSNGIDNRNVICVKSRDSTTCNGDSGGSLDYAWEDGRTYAIGLASFTITTTSEECPLGGVNGFERVDTHLDWIQATTGERFCVP